jgi:hypothetical protein
MNRKKLKKNQENEIKMAFFRAKGLTKGGACDKWDNEGRYEYLY